MIRFSLLALLTSAFLFTAAAAQNNWPRFRGPNADGVAPDNTGLPTSWTATENVKWASDVPGWGWSCPIVGGDRVFVTSVVSEEENLTPSKGLYLGQGVREPAKGVHHWMVHCFDLNTGKEIWKHEAHSGQPQVPRHPKSTYASETPTSDGERLYVLFGDLGLYCYGLEGKPLWSRKIEPKKTFFDYGAASSPVVHNGQVIVVYDNLEDSWIAAFDAKTGDPRWRKPRNETHSWATPLIWRNKLRTEIVVPGKNRNRSYSLDGKLLWEFEGRMSNLVIPSPFAAHGMCYIASGYVGDRHRPTFAIRPGASGEIAAGDDFSDSEYIAWYQGKSAPYNPSQIVYGDYLYTLFDRGFLTCHDATTGEEVYGKHRFSPSGSFTASPFAYNGHLFFLSEDGLTYVVKAGSEFEIVARNELDEFCIASPAIVGDKLLIRTASKLYCLTEGAKLDAAATARLQPRRKASSATDIWSAAAEGDRGQVIRLLTTGVSVNARQPGSGSTPLNTAAIFGQTAVAELLIEKGADVSITNPDGNTALLIASFFAHTDFVQSLLKKEAPINIKNRRGETPLDVVSANWNPQLEGTYRSVGDMIGIELDLERIKQTRPKIAELLREKAEKDSNKRSDASVSPGASSEPRQTLPATGAVAQSVDDLRSNNWHQWRGPEANGVSRTATPPIEWNEGKNIRWKVAIDGNGSSTPIIWEDKVFLLTAIDTGIVDPALPKPEDQPDRVFGIKFPNTTYRFVVLCLDRETGKELWRRTATENIPHEGHHGDNDFASASPTTDGERLYCWFGSAGLYCYDLDGDKLWERELGKAYMGASLGEGCSPVVHDGKLVIVRDQRQQSYVEVLDAKSGKTLWRADRDEPNAWATPRVVEYGGRTQVITAASNMVRSYDLNTGEIIWQCSGLTGNVIPSPVIEDNLVYCMSGYQGYSLLALPLSATGDISKSDAIVWQRNRATPYVPSPLLYDGMLYFNQSNQAILSCVDSKSGDIIMDRTRLDGLSRMYASPVGAKNRIYVTGRNGTTLVLQRSSELNVLAKNQLDDQFDASPALVENQLLLRGREFLYCISAASVKDIAAESLAQARSQQHAAVEAGEIAGGVHLVVMDGKTSHLEVAGVCDVEDRRPFKADTLVRIYSMTKPITSVAAMTLFEQGKFGLDDPISKFIPAFAETTVLEGDGDSQKTVPAKRPITVRDVFRHTTGYSYGDGKPGVRKFYEREGMLYRPPAGMLPPKMNIEQAAEALARIPALHHPGERFTYGFNTDLLGRLIEVWSGKPLDQYLQQAVLEPLEMVDTGFSIPKDKRTRFASCHTLQDGKLTIVDKAASSPFNDGFEFLSGGGGLVSTVRDYANFCQMLVDDGKFKGKRLLKPDTIELMFTDQLNGVAGGFRFGLGFAIAQVEIGSGENAGKRPQYSWGGYASTDFRLVPEERLFQIFVRQRVPSSHDLANRLFPIVCQGIGVD